MRERPCSFRAALAMALVPVGVAFGTPFVGWLGLAATGAGLWAIVGVALSYLSSAAGNLLQEKLWPRWPYDAPAQRWLNPDDPNVSSQQKHLMNEAIKRLTKLDVDAAVQQGPKEVERVLNDCVARLRSLLRGAPQADRLESHNIDYGFVQHRRPAAALAFLSGTELCRLLDRLCPNRTRPNLVRRLDVATDCGHTDRVPDALVRPDSSEAIRREFLHAVLELDAAEQQAKHTGTCAGERSRPLNRKPGNINSCRPFAAL